jgi:DDE_Tnp_1-associated/Transposase DDE domain
MILVSIFDGEMPRARLALLLHHFSELDDDREPWRVVYPLSEVVTCATIAGCDDFDDIVAWGEEHLDFLRHFSDFHHGIPGERWLRCLVNRVSPALFGRCFTSWVVALWPDRHDFIAIDGKTARRTHDRRKGLKALHTLSAYATTARLTLAQISVPEKTNEITAIPDLLDELAEAGQLKGALVTIDAMGCQVGIADKIVAHEADYLLALKGNQPTLEADVEDYFRTAPADRRSGKLAVGLFELVDGLRREADLIGLAGVALHLRQRLMAGDGLYLLRRASGQGEPTRGGLAQAMRFAMFGQAGGADRIGHEVAELLNREWLAPFRRQK